MLDGVGGLAQQPGDVAAEGGALAVGEGGPGGLVLLLEGSGGHHGGDSCVLRVLASASSVVGDDAHQTPHAAGRFG